MDYQATLNGAQRPGRDLRTHLSGLIRDVGRIADLQARLVAAELRQSRSALLCSAGCWATAGLLLVAMLPIALAALGLWLADSTELTAAGGLACVAAAATAMAIALAYVAVVQFRKQREAWERSRIELLESVRALQQMFVDRTCGETNEA